MPRARRRAASILVVLLVHVLLALLVLLISPPLLPGKGTFATELRQWQAEAAPKEKTRTKPKKVQQKPQKSPTPITPVTPPPETNDFVFGDPALRGFNLKQLPAQPPQQAQAPAETETASADDTPGEPGAAPDGSTLYAAAWQREPTNAELSYYLPRGAPDGAWALIMCKTAPRFKVEDCRFVGESPPGSRLAQGVLNAAWQFRVMPPRVNRKSLVGSWVRIRIDFSRAPAE
ncbi:hypothetical protein [Sandarakinorhabdus sp.]|uniref:hypothetical protein n=1 Tax=Sandarakinorhabdus sp. TaxID=1916663 RepID=UPI00286E36A7|nr:hypothetical protein [Sandarakinorhabdus sp.]